MRRFITPLAIAGLISLFIAFLVYATIFAFRTYGQLTKSHSVVMDIVSEDCAEYEVTVVRMKGAGRQAEYEDYHERTWDSCEDRRAHYTMVAYLGETASISVLPNSARPQGTIQCTMTIDGVLVDNDQAKGFADAADCMATVK